MEGWCPVSDARQRFEDALRKHEAWREENLPGKEINELMDAVQDVAAKLLIGLKVSITEITVDRLPIWNRTKGVPPAVDIHTVAGTVRVQSKPR